MGTADFIAPEQAGDPRRADIRADIYSLGCTLYFLLTGQPPFPSGSVMDKLYAHKRQTAPPVTQLRPDLPPGVSRIVERMLQKSPADRYQTPGEAARDLARFARSADGPPRSGRWLAAVAVLFLALVVAAGGVVFKIYSDNREVVIHTDDDNIDVVIKRKGTLL